MPIKIFEIYDGRNAFWQWDTNQKFIINDNKITEVRFSNAYNNKSKRRIVYQDSNGNNVCDIPNSLLEKSTNLIVHGCVTSQVETIHGTDTAITTINESKFAVRKQTMPEDHISEDESVVDNIFAELSKLRAELNNVDKKATINKFYSKEDAETWATTNKTNGVIVLININDNWVTHIVNDDYTVSPICNSDNDMITFDIDGGNSFGILSE